MSKNNLCPKRFEKSTILKKIQTLKAERCWTCVLFVGSAKRRLFLWLIIGSSNAQNMNLKLTLFYILYTYVLDFYDTTIVKLNTTNCTQSAVKNFSESRLSTSTNTLLRSFWTLPALACHCVRIIGLCIHLYQSVNIMHYFVLFVSGQFVFMWARMILRLLKSPCFFSFCRFH